MATVNKTKLKKCIAEINTETVSLATRIKNLNNNCNTLMNGDAEGPYWNGARAANFYKIAIKNIEKDIESYNKIYDALTDLAVRYENLATKDR